MATNDNSMEGTMTAQAEYIPLAAALTREALS